MLARQFDALSNDQLRGRSRFSSLAATPISDGKTMRIFSPIRSSNKMVFRLCTIGGYLLVFFANVFACLCVCVELYVLLPLLRNKI